MPSNRKHRRKPANPNGQIQKGITNMPTQTATTPLTVVPGPDIQDIQNTFDARMTLTEAIEDLKKKRADAKADLAQAIAKALAAAPLNVDTAVAQYDAGKKSDDALAAKIKACEELRPIIKEHEEELKKTQRDAVAAYLEVKLGKLEAEMSSEEGKEALLKHEITETKKLLRELEKPPYTEAAKSK
jgi:hypothetical protein